MMTHDNVLIDTIKHLFENKKNTMSSHDCRRVIFGVICGALKLSCCRASINVFFLLLSVDNIDQNTQTRCRFPINMMAKVSNHMLTSIQKSAKKPGYVMA